MDVDDLLVEIFVRLPLQSVQRFITTCKQWHSLITNPTFRKQWRKRTSTGLFVHSQEDGSYLVHLVPFSPDKPTTRSLPYLRSDRIILQSCNGLLLCSSGTIPGCLVYHVYNPTTNTCRTLPEVSKFVGLGTKIASLAFDPNKSPHYKVIYCLEGYSSHVHVYSSDTHGWKQVSLSDSPSGYVVGKQVYWNGSLHWMSSYTYFDIENEKLKRMPTRPPGHLDSFESYFGESCERFNYARICKSELGRSYSVYVYELKRDYSEWVFKYHVEVDYWYSILSIVHGVEDKYSFLVLKKRNKIKRYNLVTKTTDELDSSMTGWLTDTAFQYIESLCSV